jgi:hypothetical protein
VSTTSTAALPSWVAQWFPLVPRPRPPCRAVEDRIDEVGAMAREALHAADADKRDEALQAAAHVFNRAALIASDCGLNSFSHQLCWRQFGVFASVAPLTMAPATFAVQAIVNLGRLFIRVGRGEEAYQILLDAFDAVTTSGAALIEGRHVDFGSRLGISADERNEIRKFLWGKILLNDGTRALVLAGRWDEALRHVDQYRGIGERMLDGRQVAVLARCASGDIDAALALVDSADTSDPWDRAIASCLRTLCRQLGRRRGDSYAIVMTEAYLNIPDFAPHFVVPVTRLGLAVLGLAGDVLASGAREVARRIICAARVCGDAYAARDVLSSEECRAYLSDADTCALNEIVEKSWLRRGTLPAALLDTLHRAVKTSEDRVTDLLLDEKATREQVTGTPST